MYGPTPNEYLTNLKLAGCVIGHRDSRLISVSSSFLEIQVFLSQRSLHREGARKVLLSSFKFSTGWTQYGASLVVSNDMKQQLSPAMTLRCEAPKRQLNVTSRGQVCGFGKRSLGAVDVPGHLGIFFFQAVQWMESRSPTITASNMALLCSSNDSIDMCGEDVISDTWALKR